MELTDLSQQLTYHTRLKFILQAPWHYPLFMLGYNQVMAQKNQRRHLPNINPPRRAETKNWIWHYSIECYNFTRVVWLWLSHCRAALSLYCGAVWYRNKPITPKLKTRTSAKLSECIVRIAGIFRKL